MLLQLDPAVRNGQMFGCAVVSMTARGRQPSAIVLRTDRSL